MLESLVIFGIILFFGHIFKTVKGGAAVKKYKTIVITALCTAVAVIGAEVVYFGENVGSILKIADIMKIIDEQFYFDYDGEKAADYAITGLALATGDKYTNYYDKDKYKNYLSDSQNTYIGIGIVMGADAEEDLLKIYSVTDGSPAEKAGLLQGDLIVKINDEPTRADGVGEAAELIKEADGAINMLIRRNGEELKFSVEKESIEKHTVTSRKIDDDTGYIKISSFDRKDSEDKNSVDTYDEFKAEAEKIHSAGCEKLIIDLRDNPGGDVKVVTDIADCLLPECVITYFEDKKGRKKYYYSDEEYMDFDIVLLVNENSASASELLAGALKDNEKAEIVGVTTYGKGIVQNVYSFRDGSGMSVMTARYYTPGGKCIHEIGIEPDYVVENTYDDAQLDAAIEIFKK